MDKWQAEHQFEDFICYDKLDAWRNFTGLRNELNYVMTRDGARRLGTVKKPMSLEEVYVAKGNRNNL
jgi:Xaa-Pro aminopeptidase